MKLKKRIKWLEKVMASRIQGPPGAPGPPGPIGPSGPATEKALVNELLTRVAALESSCGALQRRADGFLPDSMEKLFRRLDLFEKRLNALAALYNGGDHGS